MLTDGDLVVRPLARGDEEEWLRLRAENRDWLRPWEATVPPDVPQEPVTFGGFVRQERRAWGRDEAYGAVMVHEGALVGRVSIGAIRWGAERGGSMGYWIAQSHAGRGITPRAVRLLADYGFSQGLHRLEIAIRPENEASLAVIRKLGWPEEGMRRSYLFIDGEWRDHRVFARTAD